MYLDEIKSRLEKVRNVLVSMWTISRFLWKQEFTRKSMAREALERNQQLQTRYEVETACCDDPSYFVFVNESHVDHKTFLCLQLAYRLWNDLYFSGYTTFDLACSHS